MNNWCPYIRHNSNNCPGAASFTSSCSSKMISAFSLTLPLVAVASAKIFYADVTEISGEFGVWSSTATPGTGLPGTFGVDYAFINKSAIDIYVDQNGVSSAQWANLKAAYINQ